MGGDYSDVRSQGSDGKLDALFLRYPLICPISKEVHGVRLYLGLTRPYSRQNSTFSPFISVSRRKTTIQKNLQSKNNASQILRNLCFIRNMWLCMLSSQWLDLSCLWWWTTTTHTSEWRPLTYTCTSQTSPQVQFSHLSSIQPLFKTHYGYADQFMVWMLNCTRFC